MRSVLLELLLRDVPGVRYPGRNVHRLCLALVQLLCFSFFFQLVQQTLISVLCEPLYFRIMSPGHVFVNGRVFSKGLSTAAPRVVVPLLLTAVPLGRHKASKRL